MVVKAKITINGKLHEKYFKTKALGDKWKASICYLYSDKSRYDEEWEPIPSFSRYEASTLGRLRSLNYKNSGMVIVLKPAINKDGYYCTMLLNDNNKYCSWKVHKFITLAFYGVVPDGLEVNHIDGVKINNRIDNLEYVTRSENILHAIRIGLQKVRKGTDVGNSKLTEDQIRYARKLKKDGGRFWGREKLAKEWGINNKHLQRIVNHPEKLWSHVSA